MAWLLQGSKSLHADRPTHWMFNLDTTWRGCRHVDMSKQLSAIIAALIKDDVIWHAVIGNRNAM